MHVVAVINRKGGSGKSTLATHLAGYCARSGWRVMLGDVDRQQSSMAWLRRRAGQPMAQGADVVGWALDARSVLRAPTGITHVVLDTPGGLRGADLARLVMLADAILVPVCGSVFVRDSAAACHAELMTLPRVASGRCKVAAVGMRVDARTKASEQLAAWAQPLGLHYLGPIRETQGYVRSIEGGLTLFDQQADKVQPDLAQWQPIIDWLQAAWQAAPTRSVSQAARMPTTRPAREDGEVPRSAPPARPLRVAPPPLRPLAAPSPGALSWLKTIFRFAS